MDHEGTTRERLAHILTPHASPTVLAQALDALASLSRVADTGRFSLQPLAGAEERCDALRSALACALPNRRIGRIVGVPARNPFPDLQRLEPLPRVGDAERCVGAPSFERTLQDAHAECIAALHRSWTNSMAPPHRAFVLAFAAITRPLLEAVDESVHESFSAPKTPHALRSLWYGVRTAVELTLFAAVTADRERIAQLTPILGVLPACIPLAVRYREPDAWHVVCAD